MRASLVISTYNRPQYLEMCLKSALEQTVLPSEIVIADDGSTDETRELINSFAQKASIPIKHIWHEDNGFRLCAIRNKAFAACSGDYIIQSDGDIVFGKHFVSDHLSLAEEGYFVCGSRVHLTPEGTQAMLADKSTTPKFKYIQSGYAFNSLRIKPLQKFFAQRYGKDIDRLRGCNMAFWRSDIIKVNGYNEDLTFWGHEDGELAWRLHFAGVKKKFLKCGGICFHLHHKESSRENEQTHLQAIKEVRDNRLSRCSNGIDKYL